MDEDSETSEQNLPIKSSFDDSSGKSAEPAKMRRRGAKKSGRFIRILILVIILGLIGGGVWYLLKDPDLGDEVSDESLTRPTTTQPTNTPTPTIIQIDREKVTIEIFNGTGIEKEASYLQGKLASLNYKIIDVGNASEQEYEIAEVTFSKSLDKAVVDEITELLEKTYNDLDVNTSSSIDVDVQIFTGLRSGQTLPTPEPTATPTPETTETPTPTPTGTLTPTPTPTS